MQSELPKVLQVLSFDFASQATPGAQAAAQRCRLTQHCFLHVILRYWSRGWSGRKLQSAPAGYRSSRLDGQFAIIQGAVECCDIAYHVNNFCSKAAGSAVRMGFTISSVACNASLKCPGEPSVGILSSKAVVWCF